MHSSGTLGALCLQFIHVHVMFGVKGESKVELFCSQFILTKMAGLVLFASICPSTSVLLCSRVQFEHVSCRCFPPSAPPEPRRGKGRLSLDPAMIGDSLARFFLALTEDLPR